MMVMPAHKTSSPPGNSVQTMYQWRCVLTKHHAEERVRFG